MDWSAVGARIRRLSTGHILYGRETVGGQEAITKMLETCTPLERTYAEHLLKTFPAAARAIADLGLSHMAAA